MNKSKNGINKSKKEFVTKYNELMSSKLVNPSTQKQWNEPGDQIEKFTLYGNYTPVKTTSGTGPSF